MNRFKHLMYNFENTIQRIALILKKRKKEPIIVATGTNVFWSECSIAGGVFITVLQFLFTLFWIHCNIRIISRGILWLYRYMDYYNVLIVFKKWVHGLKEFRMWIQKRARRNSWWRRIWLYHSLQWRTNFSDKCKFKVVIAK